MSTDVVVAELGVNQDGLNDVQVEQRQKEFGLNQLSIVKPRSAFVRFFSQFNDILVYTLIASAFITAFLQEWVDTWVIAGVVIINAIIGYFQEVKAENALESIRKMLAPIAVVIRNGERHIVESIVLVLGAKVVLAAGDRRSARMLPLYSHHLDAR